MRRRSTSGWSRDDEDAITAARAATAVGRVRRAVVTSGGVSMGDFDFVKVVLDRLGDMRWMQIAIKPAKPFAFGVVGRRRTAPCPCSACPATRCRRWCSFELFARPALRQMMGHRRHRPAHGRWPSPTTACRRRPDGKMHFVRVHRPRSAPTAAGTCAPPARQG